MTTMQPFIRALVLGLLAGLGTGKQAAAQTSPAGDVARGKNYFQQSCAICHTTSLGAGNTVIVKQGPSLAGVLGRRAGTSLGFNYSKALGESGIVWDVTTLDRFLRNPLTEVPGTIMPMPIAEASNRLDVIAFLSSLKFRAGVTPTTSVVQLTSTSVETDPGAWQHAAPGVKHHIMAADLPPPFRTVSAGNGPQVVKQPAGAALSVPPNRTRLAKIAGVAAWTALVAAMTVPNAAMAAPFADGNFETPGHSGFANILVGGTIGPWKVIAGSVDYGTAPAQTSCQNAGGNCVDLNGTGQGAISQTFDTCKPTYRVDFAMSRHLMLKTQPASLVALAGNQSFAFTHSPPIAPGTWVPENFSFVGVGPTTTIAFKSTTSANPVGAGPEIDNVTIKMVSCN